ncbi:MAG: precorrin-4 C(11)-methyltransferase [Pegethrix bostrychoides GSE-TBD4-15B]|jgi:precorrin-4/cobalt-precorrin-4 C11-methyltransferase|uniref:Precorrin-4 C(11)-methyltransferase n=1 Tax=Pegethrix bostrychoides GSE-TBD4-15B TaxID=2839662 RepID=A0A951U3U9_9CYAN|nr:precorrin-4 C(11)-methyltransferase [Pegethrix bostrychoides GSE-TBD4-15B]
MVFPENTDILGSQNCPESASLPALPAMVYFVGAGSGDPELLTIKAQKLLQQADVVLFADSLIPPVILEWARPDAEILRSADKSLEEILDYLIVRVRAGRSVVRLQSGDPSLYSAIHEQMQALAAAEIPFEVIPGISAFQAAAAELKLELTVPELVQTVILTRISGRTAVPEAEELAGLAAHQASLCLYLSARHVESAQDKLLLHYPADTPVAVCFRVGWPDQRFWVVPLSNMAALTQQEQLVRTTLYIVSPALQADSQARSRLYDSTHRRLFRPD